MNGIIFVTIMHLTCGHDNTWKKLNLLKYITLIVHHFPKHNEINVILVISNLNAFVNTILYNCSNYNILILKLQVIFD